MWTFENLLNFFVILTNEFCISFYYNKCIHQTRKELNVNFWSIVKKKNQVRKVRIRTVYFQFNYSSYICYMIKKIFSYNKSLFLQKIAAKFKNFFFLNNLYEISQW